MATVDDVEVANASFPNVRQDLNDILEALATNFSADAEPTTTYPNQFWYETDTNLLYIRNEADDAWITLASINQTSGEWEPRTAVIQAVDSAGLALKTDEGTTRFSISDAGVVSFENYAFPSADGSNGQVLTTDGSGTLTFEDGGAGDKIEEGNSSVEVVDTGTGHVAVTVDGSETARFVSGGNFNFNSGFGSAATAYGCRAWVNFNGTGTVAIRGDGNVSSITDNGTGDYTVNFTNSMPDATYSAQVSTGDGNNNATVQLSFPDENGFSTSSLGIFSVNEDAGGQDNTQVNVAIFR